MKKVLVVSVLAFALCSLAQAGIVYQAEFDTDGDFEGWVDFSSRGGATVSNGTVDFYKAGSSLDVQFRTVASPNPLGAGIDASLYSSLTLEIRIKQAVVNGARVEAFVRTAEYGGTGDQVALPFKYLAANDTYEVITWDIKSVLDSLSDDVLRSLRVDPQNTNTSSSIDYIRIVGEPIPEPATLALLGLGAFGLIRRRK